MLSLNNIEKKSILVIGDVMIDTYYNGDVKRISPEAPVPIFKKQSERSVLGGAANVAANLVAAGQKVSAMAIVGNDNNGDKLRTIFENQGINTDLVFSLNRLTTEKIRFLATNNQQVMRLDIEDASPITKFECERLLNALKEKIETFDLILISDYMKGLLTRDFTKGVLTLAKQKGIPAIVDVKDPAVGKYNGAYLLKPNLKELHELTGKSVDNDQEIIEASEYLMKTCNCKYILTTCGARGMVLVGESEPYFIESVGKEVFDVTGAGDTTIAYLATCMANGFPMRNAVDIANYAAGIQVSKVGTSLVYWSEVREHLSNQEHGTIYKLLADQAIDEFRENYAGKKIVFTNGCFDIMHVGHIRYLQEAAKLGDLLVVGLNSDKSVKRLKGQERPINSEVERAEMLCALSFVDYVIIFEEDTPLELIKKIQPDILVKGGDYSNEYVVGTKEVVANGGKLILLPFVEGKSTTNIINKIKH
jgi:D-beta-D-heptose 7-phosphate kinase/D-beta-D-heptose 1-phosphate adenosyltransferase